MYSLLKLLTAVIVFEVNKSFDAIINIEIDLNFKRIICLPIAIHPGITMINKYHKIINLITF